MLKLQVSSLQSIHGIQDINVQDMEVALYIGNDFIVNINNFVVNIRCFSKDLIKVPNSQTFMNLDVCIFVGN